MNFCFSDKIVHSVAFSARLYFVLLSTTSTLGFGSARMWKTEHAQNAKAAKQDCVHRDNWQGRLGQVGRSSYKDRIRICVHIPLPGAVSQMPPATPLASCQGEILPLDPAGRRMPSGPDEEGRPITRPFGRTRQR